MAPVCNKKLIRNPYKKFPWAKDYERVMKNKRVKDFKNKQAISMS